MKKLTSSLLIIATLLFTIQAGELERSLTSAHYRITLIIGSIPKMLTPEQAKRATSGEVMVGNSDLAMAAGIATLSVLAPIKANSQS